MPANYLCIYVIKELCEEKPGEALLRDDGQENWSIIDNRTYKIKWEEQLKESCFSLKVWENSQTQKVDLFTRIICFRLDWNRFKRLICH